MGSPIEDLKKLVMEGKLEKEVEIEVREQKFKFVVASLTLVEEMNVMRDAELSEPPKNDMEHVRYVLSVLAHSIKKINGVEVTKDLVKDVTGMMTGRHITPLYDAYLDLREQEVKAGTELKNS